MARWRRRALEMFPELKRDLTAPGFDIYQLYFELLPMVVRAQESGNEELLQRILDYAEWCLRQTRNGDPSNAAAVAFYEHLFQQTDQASWPTDQASWPEVVTWLSPDVISAVCHLWSLFHDEGKLKRIKQLIVERYGIACVERMSTEPLFKDNPLTGG